MSQLKALKEFLRKKKDSTVSFLKNQLNRLKKGSSNSSIGNRKESFPKTPTHTSYNYK